MTDETKVREIRAKLDAVAPMPEDGPVTAAQLGRYMAVRAQERWVKQLSGTAEIDHQQVAAMLAEFAAAHALLAHAAAEDPGNAATEIRDALEDGGAVGEWLWHHLGDETARRVSALTNEMMAVSGPDAEAPGG